MELKVTPYEQPAAISFNFEELKQELADRVHIYETAVYDDTQIQQAKADRADLNKLKKALNDERIRREKEYLKPFTEFKDKVNEIIHIIDKPIGIIDQQVKEYENREKEEKRESITEFWDGELREDLTTIPPEWLQLQQIWDERWLNKSVSMAAIKTEITKRVQSITNDVATLQDLPKFGFEAVEVYKTTLDMNRALNEARRMSEIQDAKEAAEAAKKKAQEEAEAKAKQEAEQVHDTGFYVVEPEPVPFEEPKTWLMFAAELTTTQARMLKEFFNTNGIPFKPISEGME